MVAVDLIPTTLKTAHQRRVRLRYWALTLASLFLALAALATARYLACLRLVATQDQSQQQLQVIKADLAALATNEHQLHAWSQRIAILTALQAYSDPLAAIDTLRRRTPELVYLKTMSFTNSDPAAASAQTAALPKAAAMFVLKNDNTVNTPALTPDALAITGHAYTHETVGNYLDILQKCNGFQQPVLLHARRAPSPANIQTAQPVDFEMSLRLRE